MKRAVLNIGRTYGQSKIPMPDNKIFERFIIHSCPETEMSSKMHQIK